MEILLTVITNPLGIFLSILGLVGCKIVVDVPASGSVVSNSSELACTEATRCTIDVTDFDFSETYVVEPNRRWTFNGWEIRPGGHCGGPTGDREVFNIISWNKIMLR